MVGEILQVRNVPTHEVEVLRACAAARNMSLSGYLRELIHENTSRPTMVEVLERIAARDRIEAEPADIQSFIETDRQKMTVVDASIVVRLLQNRREDPSCGHGSSSGATSTHPR